MEENNIINVGIEEADMIVLREMGAYETASDYLNNYKIFNYE